MDLRKFFLGRAIGFLVVIILVIIYFAWFDKRSNDTNSNEQVSCTMEAKECPDGSYVGRSGPNCEFALCPSYSTPVGWLDFTDIEQKIVFSYPQDLGKKYISPQEWPPVVSVTSGEFTCVTTADTSSQASRVSERQINNHNYCISANSEGAAGTTYTSYVYTTKRVDKLISVNFTLRYPQCLNYDDPQQTACVDERQNFDIDALLDEMVASIRSL